MNLKKELKWWLQRVKNFRHFFRSLFWVLYYGYPARNLTAIGVTGTDGKTTTCTLIYEILKANGWKAGLVTTIGAKYVKSSGEEICLETGLHATNPDAKELQPILKKMRDDGVTHVVLESTAHGLDQHRLLGVNFKIGVFTNLTHEHLDDFITMERYATAKLKLFRLADEVVLNKDDEWYDFFKSRILSGSKTITSYSKTDWPNSIIPNSLKGDYNKYNIAAASIVAKILKIPDSVVGEAIRKFEGVAGRREEVENDKGVRVLIDFAHTPNALKSVLTELRTETKNRLIVVFGCTGGRDRDKRPIMGRIVSEIADITVITSDDTRHENQDDIRKEIASGIKDYEQKIQNGLIFIENDRKKAIEIAIQFARTEDMVLLAGKGHEETINLGGVEYPWSDAAVAREALGFKVNDTSYSTNSV